MTLHMRFLAPAILAVFACAPRQTDQTSPGPNPQVGVCSVEFSEPEAPRVEVAIARCERANPLRRECNDEFVEACAQAGGRVLDPNATKSVMIPMAPECGRTGLVPACTDTFAQACADQGGQRICQGEGCESGACKTPPTQAALVCGTGYDPNDLSEYTCWCTSESSCATMKVLCKSTTCPNDKPCQSGSGHDCE